MHLDIRQQLEFVGLPGAYDLFFDRFTGAILDYDLRTEYLHLFLGEVSISQNVLDFYETVMQLLVAVPDMFPYGEPTAEVQQREHCGTKVFTLGTLLPVRSAGETENQGLDGTVTLRLERVHQRIDTLPSCHAETRASSSAHRHAPEKQERYSG